MRLATEVFSGGSVLLAGTPVRRATADEAVTFLARALMTEHARLGHIDPAPRTWTVYVGMGLLLDLDDAQVTA